MVLLIPNTVIENYNIDTVERAIIFAAICLKVGGEVGGNCPTTQIEITPEVSRQNNTLAIAGRFSVGSENYFRNGGGLLLKTIAREERPFISYAGIVNYLNFRYSDITPSINSIGLPSLPDSFDCFEQYFIYYFFIYWASLDSKYSRDIKLDFELETDEETGIENYYLSFTLKLKIDFDKWLLGSNYINAVEQVLTSYVVPNITTYSLSISTLNNELSLNNNLSLIN